jgi:chromosome segregation ATPase
VLRWVASWFEGEAHAIKETPMRSPILPEFNHLPHAMRGEAYIVKILKLRDELLRLKAIYRRKDAELTKLKPLLGAFNREREDHRRTLQELYAVQENLREQTARTAELERINRQLWSHVE